ncbi:proton-coupled zinc antiporter SLC30A9, mitochondrial [Zeugodacus cucurbitae]|uniref:proton-coupled zinc antiporter SLC30A9, mitochondrial n=1 Tax=Zeugodacus cucurbitae TaxID=28588 RepID=UPI0005967A04|nr:proton-coupled zinc antiporter SLC30A9, mitochondrial [Zeugodacus cucurbitae]XP_011184163.1 proton-coupled zinc antiporter SLC30A9, mitochondrial [Zeugodacus cucurbitae]XP_028896825.1 proton-coupled zinc antiporter SLC30A9, mitochondrial [Zeugodacus cucurbitae]XP_028896826.1 proton-coupled zinc antiporter SLC30A9, mitochondrial [Zeugodacus cucurbitae]
MLPRTAEIVRVLRVRQHFFGRRSLNSLSNIVSIGRLNQHMSNDAFSFTYSRISKKYANAQLLRCTYSSKKVEAAAVTSASSSPASIGNEATSKVKTTQKSATEPKQIMKSTTPTSATTAAAASLQTSETKKLEVKTTKGILSITATIEGSKINDIVFEKTKPPVAPDATIPPAKLPVSDVLKETAQAAAAQLQTSATIDAAATAATMAAATANAKAAIAKATQPKVIASATTDTATATATATTAETQQTQTAKAPTVEVVVQKPKRVLVDFNRSSLERNFITPARAMSDFLLKASDLESLSKIKRRSPYEQEPPITVYWRKDVEAKAIGVWGSRENLLKEQLKREVERKKHQQNLFTVKRRLRDYRREIGARTVVVDSEPGLTGKSGKVVLIAIGINGLNFLFKACGWVYSGSHSMFAESIHSLADTINQLILAYGIHKSTQMADSDHPYGYSNMKYVSSLISGVGIFCVGAGLSVYHGITGLMHPEPVENFFWAFFILGGSLVSEGATLIVALNELQRAAKCSGVSFKDYVLSGKDPCVNVVLTEDAAAVTSVAVAATCMGLTSITGLPVFDAVGSLLVGGILGAVASFIIYTNATALVGKSISEDLLNKINAELESDVMIRAIHDVKGIDMGNSLVRYKAEMDFDGRELTRSYLDKQELNELLKTVQSFQKVEELEEFLLKHGENIVDLMGGEIDRIEMKLRKKFPEIRHCDLEIL